MHSPMCVLNITYILNNAASQIALIRDRGLISKITVLTFDGPLISSRLGDSKLWVTK